MQSMTFDEWENSMSSKKVILDESELNTKG